MKGLTNNQLKLIALVSMTMDHIGVVLFPQAQWLRIVGRLALPIFAYMIAEGCRHTRSMGKYLLSMAALALVCQSVNYVAMNKSLYQSILVTFSLSIALIWLLQTAQKEASPLWIAVGATGVAVVYFLCQILPGLLPGTDYYVDYGFIGVLIPVLVYMGKKKDQQLIFLTLGLAALSYSLGQIQWYCLLAVPLLAVYNGGRGKWRLKWLFYIYYPAHLVAIYGLSLL